LIIEVYFKPVVGEKKLGNGGKILVLFYLSLKVIMRGKI